jgi:hypothetical protein
LRCSGTPGNPSTFKSLFYPPNIVLIKLFDFKKAGKDPKDKFMIVILQTSSDAIVAPLTTSKDYIPDSHKGKRCVIDGPSRLHCYCIPKDLPVGKNGFSFRKDTYLQVQGNLMKRSIAELTAKYLLTGAAQLMDELTDQEYCDLLYCIYKSEFVPRGIRRDMEPIIAELEKRRA